MSVDQLEQKKKKNSSSLMLDFTVTDEMIPQAILEASGSTVDAQTFYCKELLTAVKGSITAVRFRMLHSAMQGPQGLQSLAEQVKHASSCGYYVLMDLSGITDAVEAEFAAKTVWGTDAQYRADGIMISGFGGSDLIKPFLPYCEKEKKDLFVIVRSPNKSAAEIQDLLAGSRTVHLAAADNVNRYASGSVGKFGYSNVGVAVSATNGDSIKMIRSKYPKLYMVIDGLDYPGSNAKNCSYGFDRLGRGAVVCVGSSVTAAWKESEEIDYTQAAVDAAQKIQKRLDRYVAGL